MKMQHTHIYEIVLFLKHWAPPMVCVFVPHLSLALSISILSCEMHNGLIYMYFGECSITTVTV